MGRLSDNYANLILDMVFSGVTNTSPASYFIGLSSTTPANDGTNVTEPSGDGYARVEVVNNATNFPAASARAKSNGTAIEFPVATGDWAAGANMTHFVIYDASVSGNFVGWGALNTPTAVLSGNQATFAVGALDITSSGV